MTEWLACVERDVERRGLAELKPVIQALARATTTLRNAPWNADASGPPRTDSNAR